MKKTFLRALTLLLTLAVVLSQVAVSAFAEPATYYCGACGNDGVLGALLYPIAATCGRDGYEIYECENEIDGVNCPGSITLVIPATGTHESDGIRVEAVAATCTATGTVAYEKCKDCGCYLDPGTTTEIEDITVPALNHNYVPTVTDPDCTEEGYTTYVCNRPVAGGGVCGDTYIADETDALDHAYTVYHAPVEKTCRTEGYSEYYTCERCGQEDPERSKVSEGYANHSAFIADHLDATCTDAGYNVFKCTNTTCPYYAGVQEDIPANGHTLINIAAVAATCTNDGNIAHKKCTVCNKLFAANATGAAKDVAIEASSVVEPNFGGHTTVNKGYIAPSCTEEGLTNAVVCDRCGYVHHSGETIEATGHTLTPVPGKAATCTESGNIEHKECAACEKLFNVNATGAATDTPITNTVISALGHVESKLIQAATCDKVGYEIHTCTRLKADGSECGHTYSNQLAATGHTLTDVAEVPATCANGGATGTKAHKKCTVCDKLFATTATGAATDVAINADSLVISAPDHEPEVVEADNPTYNDKGTTAGSRCKNCEGSLDGAIELAELNEAVKFHYVIEGVNGADKAVNSGYVTLKVYFDVLEDEQNDKKEYGSDVIANIFGVDFAMSYDNSVFELTNVAVAPNSFTNAAFTPYATANESGAIAISQDMKDTYKVFRGENNLFATLTFQVSPDAVVDTYTFGLENILVVHPDANAQGAEQENVDATKSDAAITIDVKALGDANGDTVFNSVDSLMISTYIKNATLDTAYVAEYDMNKDGVIDFSDLDLLRKAIVGNTEYLAIIVDPNAIVPEV